MIEHRCKGRKPFKIGDLVAANWRDEVVLFVVLDIQWDYNTECWELNVLDQRTVTTIRLASHYFDPVGESND